MADLTETTDTTTESLISKFWKFAAQCQMLPMMIGPVYEQYKTAFGPNPDPEALKQFQNIFVKDGRPQTFSDMLGVSDTDTKETITKRIAEARNKANSLPINQRNLFHKILLEAKDEKGVYVLNPTYIIDVDRKNRTDILDAFNKDPPDFGKIKMRSQILARSLGKGQEAFIGDAMKEIERNIDEEEKEWRKKNPEAAAKMEAEKKAEAAAKKAGRGGGGVEPAKATKATPEGGGGGSGKPSAATSNNLAVQGNKMVLNTRQPTAEAAQAAERKRKLDERLAKRPLVKKRNDVAITIQKAFGKKRKPSLLNLLRGKVANPSPNAPAPITRPVNLQFTPKHQIKEVVGIFN